MMTLTLDMTPGSVTMTFTSTSRLHILLWLLILASGQDKQAESMSLILGPSSFRPMPRRRLMTDDFFADISPSPTSTSGVPGRSSFPRPVSSMVGYAGRSSGPVAKSNRPEFMTKFGGSGTYKNPDTAGSYIGYHGNRGGSAVGIGNNPFSMASSSGSVNSPFKNYFGMDIGKPSGISFAPFNQRQAGGNNAVADIMETSSATSGGKMGYTDPGMTRNHPFSSIRLTPISHVTGNTGSRPDYNQSPFSSNDGTDDLLANGKRLFTGGNRAESFRQANPFEKPIHRSTFPLPDVDKPITLDLAADEQKRVQYLRQNKKLPPSRNFADKLTKNSSFFTPLNHNTKKNTFNLNNINKLSLPPLPSLPSTKNNNLNTQNKSETATLNYDDKEDDSRTRDSPHLDKNYGLVNKSTSDETTRQKQDNASKVEGFRQGYNAGEHHESSPHLRSEQNVGDDNDDKNDNKIETRNNPEILSATDGLKYPDNHGRTEYNPQFDEDPFTYSEGFEPSVLGSASIGQAAAEPNARKDLLRDKPLSKHHGKSETNDGKDAENAYDGDPYDDNDNNYYDNNLKDYGDDSVHKEAEFPSKEIPRKGRYDVTVLTDEEITKVPRETTITNETDSPIKGQATHESPVKDSPAVKRVIERTINSEGEKVVSLEKRLPTDHIGFILTDDIYYDDNNNNAIISNNTSGVFTPVGNPFRTHDSKNGHVETPQYADKINTDLYSIQPTKKDETESVKDNELFPEVKEKTKVGTPATLPVNGVDDESVHGADILFSPGKGDNYYQTSGDDQPKQLFPPAVGSAYFPWLNMDSTSGMPENVGIKHPSEIFSPGYGITENSNSYPQPIENPSDVPVQEQTQKEEEFEDNSYPNSATHDVNPTEDSAQASSEDSSLAGNINDMIGINAPTAEAAPYSQDADTQTPDKTNEREKYLKSDDVIFDDASYNAGETSEMSGELGGEIQQDINKLKDDFLVDDKILISSLDYPDGPLNEAEVIRDIESEGLRLGIMREADTPMHDTGKLENVEIPAVSEKWSGKEGENEKNDRINSFTRETEEHEHVNLDNIKEYLNEDKIQNDQDEKIFPPKDKTLQYNDNDRGSSEESEVDKSVGLKEDQNTRDVFKKMTKSDQSDNLLKEKRDNSKGLFDDPSLITTNFDLLNAGEGNVSIRKVSNSLNEDESKTGKDGVVKNSKYPNIIRKPEEELINESNKVKMAERVAATTEIDKGLDSFVLPQRVKEDEVAERRKESLQQHGLENPEDASPSAPVSDVKETQKADSELSTAPEDEREKEKEREKKGGKVKEKEKEEDPDRYFKPASSYEDYDFATPTGDAFSAQSAFVKSDSSPSSSLFSAPFESLFGRKEEGKERDREEDTNSDSFGSVFQTIQRDHEGNGDGARKGVFQNKPGYSGFNGVFAGRNSLGNSLFDRRLGEIIERRPSLSLFSRKKR